jgi:hypothetical protein
LSRPVRTGDFTTNADRPGFYHETWYVESGDGTGWAYDHVVLNPHGLLNTHLDGLNHVAIDGTFYGGAPAYGPPSDGVDGLAPSGLLTRAVYVDIPALRGKPWADTPVGGTDIEDALGQAGVALESGDALLLDMGRDRFEAAHGYPLGRAGTDTHSGGGLSSEGAAWVARHDVSVLAWDMLDSHEARQSRASAHVLTWAIGLLLLDNCDFGELRRSVGSGTRVAGALVLAALAIPGANGVNCNPLVVT